MFLYLSLQTCNQLIQKNHTLLNFFKLWGSEYLGSPNILDASNIDLLFLCLLPCSSHIDGILYTHITMGNPSVLSTCGAAHGTLHTLEVRSITFISCNYKVEREQQRSTRMA